MRPVMHITVLLFLFATVSGCAHLPRYASDSQNLDQLRETYLNSHPKGDFNSHIVQGEVVKGMDFLAVLASWGLPNERRMLPGDVLEYWTYYTVDKEAGQVTIYELIFKNRVLMKWNVDKNVAGAGGYQHLAKQKPLPATEEKGIRTSKDHKKKEPY